MACRRLQPQYPQQQQQLSTLPQADDDDTTRQAAAQQCACASSLLVAPPRHTSSSWLHKHACQRTHTAPHARHAHKYWHGNGTQAALLPAAPQTAGHMQASARLLIAQLSLTARGTGTTLLHHLNKQQASDLQPCSPHPKRRRAQQVAHCSRSRCEQRHRSQPHCPQRHCPTAHKGLAATCRLGASCACCCSRYSALITHLSLASCSCSASAAPCS